MASLVIVASEARAAVPDGCPGFGAALVDHSCFHSTHGPFATRAATPGATLSNETPDLDDVHTEYRVGLAGSESSVTYEPERSGAFSVFLGSDVPLRILREEAVVPEILTFEADTGCEALPISRVFDLVARDRYQLVFGPTASQTVVVVIEYVDDFLISNGRDADGDGYGTPLDSVRSACVPPEGYVQNTSDCNDADSSIHPGAAEACGDAVDQNCNGLPDDTALSCAAGEGVCRRTGEFACGDTGPVCSATPGESTAETCNGLDDDCNGSIDDAAALCTDPERPACVREARGAFCGCILDVDCGPPDSGKVCLAGEQRCVSGCGVAPGRNGCPAGYECRAEGGGTGSCELKEPEPPEGGAGGEAGAGGSPGASGTEGARAGDGGSSGRAGGGGTAAENSGAGEPGESGGQGGEPDDDSRTRTVVTQGCGCRVGAAPNAPGWNWALGLLAVLALRRRRLRTAGSLAAFVGLSMACGGRSIYAADDDRDHDHDHGHGPAGTAGSPSAGGTGTSGAAGGAVGGRAGMGGGGLGSGSGGTGGVACIPELGKKPIEHACSHMELGPFAAVAALPPGSSSLASISTVQTAFEVDVVGERALLSYVPSRNGAHVILTDKVVSLVVSDQSSSNVDGVAFGVSGCEAIDAALSVPLRIGEEYTVEIHGDMRSFNVFIEHLGTFGEEAWMRSCEG